MAKQAGIELEPHKFRDFIRVIIFHHKVSDTREIEKYLKDMFNVDIAHLEEVHGARKLIQLEDSERTRDEIKRKRTRRANQKQANKNMGLQKGERFFGEFLESRDVLLTEQS